ncbi:hypothetical protein Vafri_17046 [Volvox africanus]|uniref:Haloacid dehalogenase-like hydrolase domain-containing protein 3 n=1 Tax=Volvox africanus TaxID=51714 RepID=A0A8J4BJT5_9CHLO|nr:hypothetical protein Vafri_17046 [Volvox africanus]
MLNHYLRAVAPTICRLLPCLAYGQRSIHEIISISLSSYSCRQTARSFTAEAFAYVRPTEWRACYRAVLVDAAGTFLLPSEPVSTVYLRYASPYGCQLSDEEVLARFRRAYNLPWPGPLRYVGDARPFWRRIVEHSTGCRHPEVSEAIYQYYARAEAWHVVPGAVEALQRLKAAGVLLGVVSNFDTRLRPLLRDLRVEGLFDAVIVSAEVRAEKPNPVIFDAAVETLGAVAMTRGTVPIARAYGPSSPVSLNPTLSRSTLAQQQQDNHHHQQQQKPYPMSYAYPPYSDFGPLVSGNQRWVAGACVPDFGPLAPEHVLHVGDDRRNDCWGARDAGITAWLWGYDVRSWAEVADRVLLGSQVDEYYDDLADAV